MIRVWQIVVLVKVFC